MKKSASGSNLKIVNFGILIHVLSWIIYFRLLRKETQTENQQLFDGIIDFTSFDRVEGLNYWEQSWLKIIYFYLN